MSHNLKPSIHLMSKMNDIKTKSQQHALENMQINLDRTLITSLKINLYYISRIRQNIVNLLF